MIAREKTSCTFEKRWLNNVAVKYFMNNVNNQHKKEEIYSINGQGLPILLSKTSHMLQLLKCWENFNKYLSKLMSSTILVS